MNLATLTWRKARATAIERALAPLLADLAELQATLAQQRIKHAALGAALDDHATGLARSVGQIAALGGDLTDLQQVAEIVMGDAA